MIFVCLGALFLATLQAVPERQSVVMKKALEKAGKRVTYIEFEGQSHGGWRTEDEIDHIDETIAFLKPMLEP